MYCYCTVKGHNNNIFNTVFKEYHKKLHSKPLSMVINKWDLEEVLCTCVAAGDGPLGANLHLYIYVHNYVLPTGIEQLVSNNLRSVNHHGRNLSSYVRVMTVVPWKQEIPSLRAIVMYITYYPACTGLGNIGLHFIMSASRSHFSVWLSCHKLTFHL